MSEEMREAAFVILLVERARTDVEAHQCGARRRGILAQDIAHAVFEHAEAERRIDRNVALLERPYRIGGWWCRSEEHTSELQSLMRISYAVFCLKKKTLPRLRRVQQHERG